MKKTKIELEVLKEENTGEIEIKTEETGINSEEKKTKKPFKKWILLSVILIIVLGIGACYQLFSKNVDKIIDQDKSTSLY